MTSTQHKRTPLSKFNYFPVFIDYNFAESRPRGGSACIDFFACGKLCALMDEVDSEGVTFVTKEDLMPESGFFLVDFAQTLENPREFISSLKKMNLSHIYVEDSQLFPLKDLLDKETDIAVSYVMFRA